MFDFEVFADVHVKYIKQKNTINHNIFATFVCECNIFYIHRNTDKFNNAITFVLFNT